MRALARQVCAIWWGRDRPWCGQWSSASSEADPALKARQLGVNMPGQDLTVRAATRIWMRARAAAAYRALSVTPRCKRRLTLNPYRPIWAHDYTTGSRHREAGTRLLP